MIYTLSSSTSFCDELAKQWQAEKKDNIWGLSHITVFVPTIRSAKTLKEAFLRQSGGQTLLLPKIISFSNIDFLMENVPEAISPLERQLLLSKLVQKKQPMSEDKAYTLAASLAELIDQLHDYDVDFQKLKDIVPDNFASHWQQTLSFLEIVETYWPLILKERNQTDPALRQIRLVENLIHQWKVSPPKNPIIAIGFTGGLPIVEKFLKAVNELPNGDIYIPNLDKCLTDEEWESLDATHPQFYLKKLLETLNVKRNQIVAKDEITDRFKLLSMLLKPAKSSANWYKDAPKLKKNCIQNLERIECKNPQTEAFEIACRLREVLETPEKTAALVTTDRSLARRVHVQMTRWGIELDDSVGTPLARTPVGTFLILLAEAGVSQKSTDLLTLLKHPLALDGDDFTTFRKKIHQAEKQARKDKVPFSPRLKTDLTPFMNLFVNPVRQSLRLILQTHLETAQSLATSSDRTGAERLWDKEAGSTASELLTELLTYADLIGDIEPITYPAFLTAVLNSVSVRPKYGMHPRLDILGPIEARLQQPDVIIIAGMNEGTFPQLPETDAWINRPMRQVCGLPAPEEKIGVSAQDFMHLMQAKQVILTRSLKVDGSPTIPSRWWSRLDAVLQCANISCPIEDEKFISLVEIKESFNPAKCPKPTPPVEIRPTEFSVSDISTLMKDPYSIYARKILKLFKLDELDNSIQAIDFGNAVHNALALYVKKGGKKVEELLEIGEKAFAREGIYLEENPFIMERFKRIANWFVLQNTLLDPHQSFVECPARMTLPLNKKEITITGRADRIDVFGNKKVSIIDYKTGSLPSKSQVHAGFAPQLPLEAIMLEKGCFKEIRDEEYSVNNISYWRLIGKANGGEILNVTPDPKKVWLPNFWKEILDRLSYLLSCYQDKNTPYSAHPQVGREQTYNDYAHLERQAEWQVKDGDEEE
ncbi:MAG: PD-(D/E)XK nuclease family protein [Alphaproteobacteria bacterium]|nr:PD-(D/E)XK nuclease family protein [Alphaproteobacteria bacterium]